MAISKIITGSLTDDAVTSAKIGTDQVGADALSSSAISGAVDIPANSVGQSELSIDLSAQSVPHIIPGVLYPSYVASGTSNKLLDGTTNHSGAFGTEQSDGRKYYYTNIKGSKPIKDPRIGGHFGSQRHKFKSLQLLEQETATHGTNVYSVDGREWVRAVGNELSTSYDANGHYTKGQNVTAGSFMEVVGYFLDANLLNEQHTADRNLTVQVNGSSAVAFNDYTATLGSPLAGRYVDEAVLINIDLPTKNSASLGINTLRINFVTGTYPRPAGIELIAQDLSGSGSPNRSKIKFPAQNVVSAGKKFEITETNHHYDPFNGFTSGSSVSSYIDTDTSLGVEKWKSSSTYYRPYNGGRVVKWVDSSGVIKTSVTLMPPNAKSIADSSSLTNANAKANASASNDTFYPTFEAHTTDVNEDQLHEVAKTFHFREFGNGSANGGTGSGSYADASMLNSADDIAYVMDDGLTSLVGDNVYVQSTPPSATGQNDKGFYFTFIGTGLNIQTTSTDGTGVHQYVQNLPYGTHIVKHYRGGSGGTNTADSVVTIDGVSLGAITIGNYSAWEYVSFFQPKKPPIPEDAVVLADYMLMADFVPNTTQGIEKISKGSRLISASRDFIHDAANGTLAFTHADRVASSKGGMTVNYVNPGVNEVGPELTWFGDAKMVNEAVQISDSTERSKHYFDGSTTDVVVTSDYTDSGAITTGLPSSSEAHYCVYGTKTSGVMGKQVSKFVAHPDDASNDWLYYGSAQVSTPIHTSSHYQSFETQHLHELIGGDRNMEQNNLVVSPDGKTWDQITRDTSYLGNVVVSAWSNLKNGTYGNANTDVVIWDIHRGDIHNSGISPASNQLHRPFFNKHFAIAYDRHICLEDGVYTIVYSNILNSSTNTNQKVLVNQEIVEWAHASGSTYSHATLTPTIPLKRGDYVQVTGGYFSADDELYGKFEIRKVS